MDNTNATRENDGVTAGETLVITNPAKVVIVEGHYISVEEIAFARNVVGTTDIGHVAVAGDRIAGPTDGCLIEFKRKGTVFVPGLTVEGLGSLVNNAPF